MKNMKEKLIQLQEMVVGPAVNDQVLGIQCDGCRRLLFSGTDQARYFEFGFKSKDLVTRYHGIHPIYYCSEKCAESRKNFRRV